MIGASVRTTPPTGPAPLANTALARDCIAAWYASSGYDHAGNRIAVNADKTNCAEGANQYGKEIRFSGSQGPAAYTLANKPGHVLEGATAMTILVAASVQTGAARTLVSATGTTAADNSWSLSVNSSGMLSMYVSNASSSSRTYTANAAITSNKRGVYGAVWRGSDDLCGMYVDGVEVAGTKLGSARSNIDPTISLPISIGALAVATSAKLIGTVEWVLIFDRALSPAEIRALSENPYQLVTAANSNVWLDVIGGGGGVTGNLSATDVQDSAAIAGGYGPTGALAATDPADSASFSGSASDPGVSGSLSAVDVTDTVAFSGALIFVGSLASVDSPDVAAMSGAYGPTGQLAASDQADIASLSGGFANGVDGSLSASDVADVATFGGAYGPSGTLAAIEQQDVAGFVGTVPNNAVGTIGAVDAQDVAYFSGAGGDAGRNYGGGKLSPEYVQSQWDLLELRLRNVKPAKATYKSKAKSEVDQANPAPKISEPDERREETQVIGNAMPLLAVPIYRQDPSFPVVPKPVIPVAIPAKRRSSPVVVDSAGFVDNAKPAATWSDEDDESALMAILEVI